MLVRYSFKHSFYLVFLFYNLISLGLYSTNLFPCILVSLRKSAIYDDL